MGLIEAELPAGKRDPEDRAQLIRDRLRDAVIDRRLAPGTKLSEQEVGDLFEVSRTVARAALQFLAFEGLVRIERNRGAFVANPRPEEARQVFAARRLVEPGIVAAVCEHATAANIADLRRHLEEEDRHLAEHGPEARRAEIKASGDFHLKLAEIGDNAVLFRFMEELIARSSLVIALYGRSGTSSCGHGEHAEIVDMLERREVAKAQELIQRHIDHIEADLELRTSDSTSLREALGL